MSGPNAPRGTTNRNQRGNTADRRARRQWLLNTFDGGTYAYDNIRPACGPCNSRAGTALREERKTPRVH